jgi:hypothetical protein
MTKDPVSRVPSKEVCKRVVRAFLVFHRQELLLPWDGLNFDGPPWKSLVEDAADGLISVMGAGCLPFELTLDAVHQRRFDRILIAEQIRSRIHVEKERSEMRQREAYESARQIMNDYVQTQDGGDDIQNEVIFELDHRLLSDAVRKSASELLSNTLISIWSVFENFAGSFITYWINQYPQSAKKVLNAPELKNYFGKGAIDIEAIYSFDFDLTRSMGSIIFRDKRLDNLTVIRNLIEVLLCCPEVRAALQDDIWMLNQRRHLFVHKRGIVDQEYLDRTGDKVEIGQRLDISSHDVERYYRAVQCAIVAISNAARKLESSA